MSTQIAEPPPTQNANVAQPLPSSRQAGMVPIADALVAAQKGAPAAPEPENKAPVPEVKQEKPAAQSLLESVAEAKTVVQEVEKTKQMDAKRAADWKKVNEEREQYRSEAEKLRLEVADAAKLKSELEALKPKASRVDELERKLEETAFERSDKYQRLVTEKEGMVSKLRELAGQYEVNPDIVDQALAMKDKKRSDFLETTFADTPLAAAKFERWMDDIDAKGSNLQAEMTKYREKLQSLGAEEARKSIEMENEQRAEVMRAFDAVLPKISDKLPYFKDVAGDEAHNASVKSDLEMARKIISGEAPLEDQVTAPYLAVIAKRLISRNNGLETENAQLKERLAKYNGNTPGLTSGATDSVPASNQKMGMMESLKARS